MPRKPLDPTDPSAGGSRARWTRAAAAALLIWAHAAAADQAKWPPQLPGANEQGTATVTTRDFLKVPASVEQLTREPKAMPFVVAKAAPTVDLAYHGDLPYPGANGTGWTSWGDICVAGDGRVYVGVGDHGQDSGGPDAWCFIYRWDPTSKVLEKVVNVNQVVGYQKGDPRWTKVHARIVEGKDNNIYFTCTLNDGGRAATYKWTKNVPGGQIFRFDPATGRTRIIGHYDEQVTPTTLIDRDRMIFWANLEPTGTVVGYDLVKRRIAHRGEPGQVGLNRNIALANSGDLYFMGKDGAIWKYDVRLDKAVPTKSRFSGGGMRSSTRESSDGWIYGTTYGFGDPGEQLFRYSPKKDKLELLGRNFLMGYYITVAVLSPDEKYVYFLPGAHGRAVGSGTPVVQYTVKTGRRKVIAFLKEAILRNRQEIT